MGVGAHLVGEGAGPVADEPLHRLLEPGRAGGFEDLFQEGVRAVDEVLADTCRAYAITGALRLRVLVLRAASPQILTGMRISLAISLILAILGEMIVSNDGLGYFVLLSQRTFKVPEMYAGIFTLALFGYALNRIFLLIEASLVRWHHESSGRV